MIPRIFQNMEFEKAAKLVAILILASGILKAGKYAFFQSIGFLEGSAFYAFQIIAALILAIGVYRGYRWAWVIAAVQSALLAYYLLNSLISFPWVAVSLNWKGVVIFLSLIITLILYFLVILSFFWLEKLKIGRSPANIENR